MSDKQPRDAAFWIGTTMWWGLFAFVVLSIILIVFLINATGF